MAEIGEVTVPVRVELIDNVHLLAQEIALKVVRAGNAPGKFSPVQLAWWSYELADALMHERTRRERQPMDDTGKT